MIKQFLTKAIFKSVIRHIVTSVCGYFLIKGFATHEQIDLITQVFNQLSNDPKVTAAVLAIGAIGHSALEKRKVTDTTKVETVVTAASPEKLETPHNKE